MVLPTALELGITFAIKPRSDNVIRISSDKFDDLAERHLSDIAREHWSDYITGAVKMANEQKYLTGGVDIAVETITVGVLKLTRDMARADTLDKDIAVLARRVENEFIGMPCGIMDQMAVAIARPGQALALDTENLDYDLVDLPQDYHRLGHDNICQISDADFKSLHDMPDVLQRRARHCMSDHRRTIDAVACLRAHDMEEFGRLMNESHISMRDDFEITVPKVDDLVKDAVKFGALGARQTGGGFGGCIVACVPKTEVKTWTKSLLEHHPQAFWVS